jgi:iron(III) transport system substrate-binding protein
MIAVLLMVQGCGWTAQSSSGSATGTLAAGTAASDPGTTMADGPIAGAQTMTLYTCANDPSVQAAIQAFTTRHPGTSIDVFRAPTGQLNARIAADVRGAGLGADVVWACDPITMQGYLDQGVVRSWVPGNAGAIPAQFRTADYVGVDLLTVVAAVHQGVTAPRSWSDLTAPAYQGRVAVPNPGFAASALGLLGYFDSAPGYGLEFYQKLATNGAVQVDSPTDVLTGVAQGTYDAGIVLANAAYDAQQQGSPIDVVWPEPGAVAIYAPIATTTRAAAQPLAEAFVTFLAGRDGQQVLAQTDVYPTLSGIPGPPIPEDATIISPDWPAVGAKTEDLLGRYRAIFG